MTELLTNPAFWQAMASFAWPIVLLIIFLTLRGSIKSILRGEDLNIRIAGMEINVKQATKQIGEQVAQLQEEVANIKSPAQESIATGKKTTKRILWVDDYPSNNAFLIDRFKSEGIEVQIALSTEDGLRLLEVGNYAALITDLGRMERGADNPLAGIELIRTVREKGYNGLPILVFAGRRALEMRDSILAAGATDATNSATDVVSFVNTSIARSP